MSRLKLLEARRRALLARCDAQREELAARLAQLNPGTVLQGSPLGQLRHPLAWGAALAAMLLLRRTREVVTFILWTRTALTLAARAVSLVRVLTQPRAGSPGR
jgi:hypothetical protein